jgi:hypothetical protein
MEKIPGLRAIGNASIEDKEKVKKELSEGLSNHNESFSDEGKELLLKIEKEKTPKELELIYRVNYEINSLREEMGLEKFEIPADNYHILDKDGYKDNIGITSAGQASFDKQGIYLNEGDVRRSLLSFFSTILHESLHLNGHTTVEVNEYEDGRRIVSTFYRTGIGVHAAQKKGFYGESHSHFDGLHEAIVSEQEKRSLKRLMDDSLFNKERDFLYSQETEILKNTIIKNNPSLQKEDILWVDKDGENFDFIPYDKTRKVLNFVCDSILEKFPEQFSTQDEVFKLFLKSHFTGQLLDIARLVEQTFGEGSFRRLGDMDATSSSAINTYEALRKMNKKTKH